MKRPITNLKKQEDETFDNLAALTKLTKLEEINYAIKDINISELIPNVIKDVIIYIDDTLTGQEVVQDIPVNMGGISFRNWRNDLGGIFVKDLKNFLKGNPSGKYALLSDKDESLIIRFIEDEELRIFSVLNLLHGKIKDKAYMIFKRIQRGESFTTSERYIIETPTIMSEDKIPIIEDSVSNDDGETYTGNSISLFDD